MPPVDTCVAVEHLASRRNRGLTCTQHERATYLLCAQALTVRFLIKAYDQLLSVMTIWVAPAFAVTVRVVALNVPPVTVTTFDVRNTGSWMFTAPPGSVPLRFTVMTRPAAGWVTASDTP